MLQRDRLFEIFRSHPTLSLLVILETLTVVGAYTVSALGFYAIAGILGAYAAVIPVFLLLVLLYLRVLPIIAS
ncbi:hypothetical protein D3261_04000 [Halococcus sp. IIIV-5B]|nr:hypothetical protein D3261_04000 [Halococcus sp. IIIV-5B]